MYLLLSIVILIISYKLFKLSAGSMKFTEINFISLIFYLQLFLFCWFGSILIVYNIDDHYSLVKLSSNSVRVKGWLLVMYTMIAIPSGLLISKRFFTKYIGTNLFHKFKERPIQTSFSENDSYLKFFLYIFTFIAFLVFLYLIHIVGDIPILKLLKGSSVEELAVFRIYITRSFPGNQYLINLIGLALTPVISYIAFGYYLHSKSSSDLLWFLSTTFMSIGFVTYNLEKSPVVFYLLGYILLFVILRGQIKRKTLLTFGLVSLALIIIQYVLTSNYDPTQAGLSFNQGILGRIFLTQIAGLYNYLDIFPNQTDFIGFSSISGFISNIFGLQHSERAARLVMEILNPKLVELGIAGVINTLFIGEAWANFGILGVLISPIYVGFYVGIIYFFILSSNKTPLIGGIYAYFSVKTSITGGINDFIYSPVMFMLIIIFSTIVLIAYSLKYNKKNTSTHLKINANHNSLPI